MKKNIKMVVTDLDGTLLSPQKEISQKAIEVIQNLKEQDIKFTFITGRPPYGIQRFAQQVEITAPIIGCNGAMLVSQDNMEVMQGKTMDIFPLKSFLEKVRQRRFTTLIMSGNTEYALGETSWTKKRAATGRALPIIDLSYILKENQTYKINVMKDEESQDFSDLIPELQTFEPFYSIALYGESGCEIVSKEVDKGTGLLNLCKICKLDPEQVLAIGDNANDLPMLKLAGIGAAVGNAASFVKDVADYTCQQDNTDGVIEAILKFALS